MRAYIIRRLLLIIPTVFLASFILFFAIRLIPGDIIDLLTAQMQMSVTIDRAAIEHALGLDVPLFIQYGRWVGNIVMHGNLGGSLWTGRPVISEIIPTLPVTLELGLLGLIVSQIIACL